MMLSVMVMGAGAAFTDQDKIVNEEAVDMISALGIVDGYEDDSFQPEKNIERGEAAKMIAVMLNGGKDAVQDTSVSSFNDVLGSADAWANKYIEYGVSKGILAGVGGDRFAPASNVTGTQLAKMLLVSLGYDADKEGYLDDTSWAVNVNADAASAGLYAGVESIDMNAALTRDNAAQMIWNALQANTVKYSILGGLTETSTTLLQKAFGKDHDTTTGILTDIFYNQDTKVYTYTVNACDSSAKLTDEDGIQFKSTVDYSDLFAMNVKVLYDDNNALCIRTDKGGVVVEGVWGDIDDVQNAHFNTITVDGQKYTLDNVAKDMDELWDSTCGYNRYGQLNVRYTGAYADPDIDRYGLRNSDPKFESHVQYSFVGIDQDGGGDIDVFVVYPYVVLRSDRTLTNSFQTNVIEWDDASMVVANTNSYWAQDYGLMRDLGIRVSNRTGSNVVEYDDVLVNGTVAENGYVMGVPAQYTATGIDTYTVLDIQSAAATSLNSADRMITLGSTEYDGILLDWINPVSTISLGETYAFVEVNGYLFIVDGNNIGPVKDEYVVVTKTAAVPHGVDKLWETNILKTDGTTETVDVYVSLNDGRIGPEVGSLYTYRVNQSGDYELIAVPGGCYGTDFNDENTNFDVQQAYKAGATLNNKWETVIKTPGSVEYKAASGYDPYGYVGCKSDGYSDMYNVAIKVDSAFTGLKYYKLTATEWTDGVATKYTPTEVTFPSSYTPVAIKDYDMTIGTDGQPNDADTYYYNVKAVVTAPIYDVETNVGISSVYDENTAGGYFGLYCTDRVHNHETNTVYQIEDDAVIFVYNRMMDEYSVVKGSDLENIAVGEISWAFTGATAKVYDGTPTVDLGYVAVSNDPDETLIYAYVNANPNRTLDADGNAILTVDVIVDGGEKVTLTAHGYDYENDPTLLRLYRSLTESATGVFQLIVDGTTLVDIKDYAPVKAETSSMEVTAVLYGGVIELDGEKYFVDADTEFIPVSGEASSIGEIVKGEEVDIILDKDADGDLTNDILAVIY